MNSKFFANPRIIFLFSCFFNASFVVFAKLLGEFFTNYELSFYRALINFLMSGICIILATKKIPSFKKINLLFFLKSVLALLSMLTWFVTINHLPVSETIAVSFSTPIFTGLLAVLLLKEKCTKYHVVAFICGLIGICIIASPEFGKMDFYALVGLLSCFLLALSFIIIKILLRKNYEAAEINFYGTMLLVPMAFFLSFEHFSFSQVKIDNISVVLCFGFCIFCADLLQNLAYKKTTIMNVTPIMFVTIVIAIFYDYVIFNVVIEKHILLGALIVLFGIFYLSYNTKSSS